MNRILTRMAAAMLAAPALTLAAQADTPVIDNTWVTVHDLQLVPGTPGPTLTHPGDYVVLHISGGRVQSNGTTATHAAGSATFGHGGTVTDTALDGPVHEVVVDLKDAPSGTVPNTTGLPLAFPRPGSKKVFENNRVIVWNYAWQIGKPTPMHFHDKNVVVVYAGDGPLKGVSPDGKEVVNNYKAGEIRFNTANRAHYEQVMSGQQSAVMMELK
jgi:hypothetical protein